MTNGQILQLKIWVFNFKVQTYKEVKSEGRILEGSQVACFRFCNLMLKRRRFEYFGFSIRFDSVFRDGNRNRNQIVSIRFGFSSLIRFFFDSIFSISARFFPRFFSVFGFANPPLTWNWFWSNREREGLGFNVEIEG